MRKTKSKTKKSIWKLSLIALLAAFLLTGIVQPLPAKQAEAAKIGNGLDENDTIYQIMTDRFSDGDTSNNATGTAIRYAENSDEDFRYMKGGDWQGIINKLPYIKNMGYTAIWISPIAEPQITSRDNNGTGRNTAYHGYNVKDPNKANPFFGTKEKLKELVDTAHSMGIKIIIDVVPNHVGDYMLNTNNFYDIAGLQPAAPFNNPAWYHHNGDINWSLVDGSYTAATQDYLENHDLAGLDDIDFDNAQAKQAMFDSIKGWFDYTGADGARVDAAKLVNPSVLHELQSYLGVNTFGENFDGNAEFVSRWVGSNAEWGMLDFPMFFSILNSFAYGQSFEANVKSTLAQDFRYNGSENHMVTFIDNHDRNRFLTEAGGNVQKLQNALAFIFTMRGLPVVFQGTEQNKGNGNDQIMTGGIADTWNRWSMVKRDSNGNVIQDYFNQNTNTYQFVAKLNGIRKNYEALRTGKQREMWAAQNLYAFSRRVDSGTNVGQEVIGVFSNAANGTQTVTIPLRTESTLAVGTVLTNQLGTDTVTVQSGGVTGKQITVSVDANSSKIYAVQQNDTVAPTTPANLTAGTVTSSSATISWTASTDNIAVTGYEIYRDGVLKGTSATPSYTDTTVQPSTTYSYTVKAYDAAGNKSALSSILPITTPVAGTNSVTVYYKQGYTTPFIHYRPVGGTWTTAPGVAMPASEVAGYNKFTVNVGDATQLEAVFNNGSGTWDNNGGLNYKFNLGTWTFNAGTITAGGPTGGDPTAPTTPTNVTAGTVTATSVPLTWTASTDNVGVTGYEVYRDGVLKGTTATTSYTDTTAVANTTYVYTVKAYDAAGNKSTASTGLTVTTPSGVDTQAPTSPINVTAGTVTTTTVPLTWTASSDNVGVTGYEVYRDGVLKGTTATASYTDTTAVANTTYVYTVKAYDAAGNKSTESTGLTVTTPQAGTNSVTIYYKNTSFTNKYIHYSVNGTTTWTTAPGVAMTASSFAGYSVVTIDLGAANGLKAAFNNGSGSWDNNNSANYSFGVGTYTLVNGSISTGVPQADSLTINLTVPANTPANADVYIASTLNAWNAADVNYKMTRNANGTYSITIPVAAGTAISYKFTRGAWTNVEINSNGTDIANRTITTSGGAQTLNLTVQRWKDL
ncbi:alpha amylase catalytic region [Paenibacillus curdlanolyticus YK9]|uniref:Alpha amylase catalytic region n=1 Tax=Paenibacillus curdlanolyticus YK9 TaxID=717606 RepID=E0ICK5_9BACL|nr:alpha-amylase family glycosyl hydrolase [Paenibacillus curdlanolyticus]EFM09891.1 alpha amylase catalytic region [Paenibacillus curdlanolyticus YK9]